MRCTIYPKLFCLLLLVLVSFLLFPSPVFSRDGDLGRDFMLRFLMAENVDTIDREIRMLAEREESTEADSAEGARVRYALGILHVYRHLRLYERGDAFRAEDLLEASEEQFEASYFHRVHLGMAHASLAKIRRVFGVSNLKEMRAKMESIPDDHPDWLLRFLRGTTLVEVGAALPGIFSMKEIKVEAVDVGTVDLEYVLARHREDSVEYFRPESYDYETMPVPDKVAERSREVLRRAR